MGNTVITGRERRYEGAAGQECGRGVGIFRETEDRSDAHAFFELALASRKQARQAERTVRDRDDYPVRVYVVSNGGLVFWLKKALHYIWANNSPKDRSGSECIRRPACDEDRSAQSPDTSRGHRCATLIRLTY
ncbi:DUF3047 domain-containing protein [Methylomicrobium sp. RS1]|nr:DUF3047 domain-containing protein [Methylomicrobium sp. RS1]